MARRSGNRSSGCWRRQPPARFVFDERVSMVGITDMPGRSSMRGFLPVSSAIRTGMRCTTLVKLPVALSGGSSANSWPLAGAMLIDMAVHDLAREHVHLDIDGLAFMHVGELRFPCSSPPHRRRSTGTTDINCVPACTILADAQRAVADDAVDRGRDRGVAEIELGLALHRLGARASGGIGLRDLGLEQVDLLEGGCQIGVVARQRGLCARIARLRLLRVLDAARAARGKIGVALVLLRGEGRRGLVDIERRLSPLDITACWTSSWACLLAIVASAAATSALAWSSATLKSRSSMRASTWPVVTRSLSFDQHLIEIAGDLRRDGGAVGLHIGVVGRHQILADGPVVPAIPGRARQHGDRRSSEQQLAKM